MGKTNGVLRLKVIALIILLCIISFKSKAQEYPKAIVSNTTIETTDTLWILTHSQYKTALQKILTCNNVVLYQDSIITQKDVIITNKDVIIKEHQNDLISVNRKLDRSRWWNVGLGSGLFSSLSIIVAIMIVNK